MKKYKQKNYFYKLKNSKKKSFFHTFCKTRWSEILYSCSRSYLGYQYEVIFSKKTLGKNTNSCFDYKTCLDCKTRV